MRGNTDVFLVDCDTGVDDALALALLLARRPNHLVAVTTVFGNVGVERATRNTIDLLALAGAPSTPVHVGAATSLDGAFTGTDGAAVHGADGFGGAALPRSAASPRPESAPAAIVRAAHAHRGRLVIIALGPVTNIAMALTLDPAIAVLIDRIVVMGGAFAHPGNATPVAEANVWHDPEALARVLASGARVRFVPLDATMPQRFTRAHQRSLASAVAPLPRALGAAFAHYLAFYTATYGHDKAALHDPLAVAIALGEEQAQSTVTGPVTVVTDGVARGKTIVDLRTGRPTDASAPSPHDVVLRTADGFGDRLADALLGRA